jgi:RNA polymerase sigma-70 factor (ECF subfamily)
MVYRLHNFNFSLAGKMLLILTSILETQDEKDRIEHIYLKYRQLYMDIANKVLRNPDVADDIVYDTFLTIIEHKDEVFHKSELEFKRWSVMVLENKCRNYLRKQGKTPETVDITECEDLIEDYSDIPIEIQIETKEDCEKISLCLEELSELNCQIVKMYYFQHLKIKEIAAILDMSVEQINSRLERSRRKLALLFEKEGVGI